MDTSHEAILMKAKSHPSSRETDVIDAVDPMEVARHKDTL